MPHWTPSKSQHFWQRLDTIPSRNSIFQGGRTGFPGKPNIFRRGAEHLFCEKCFVIILAAMVVVVTTWADITYRTQLLHVITVWTMVLANWVIKHSSRYLALALQSGRPSTEVPKPQLQKVPAPIGVPRKCKKRLLRAVRLCRGSNKARSPKHFYRHFPRGRHFLKHFLGTFVGLELRHF